MYKRQVVATADVVVHADTTARCGAPRRKVELGLPEVHLGVVPTAGNIDVSFSRWKYILVVNVEVFRTDRC